MLLEAEIALEVGVICRREDIDEQDARHASKRLLQELISMSTQQAIAVCTPESKGECGGAIFICLI
jgi:hypothetical protein